jgi:hypothetical protein
MGADTHGGDGNVGMRRTWALESDADVMPLRRASCGARASPLTNKALQRPQRPMSTFPVTSLTG